MTTDSTTTSSSTTTDGEASAPKKPAKRTKPRTAAAPAKSGAAWNRIPSSALSGHADEIDVHLAMLHAAILHVQGEFVAPPSKAFNLIEDSINAIRWETAQMRRASLGLDDGKKGGSR